MGRINRIWPLISWKIIKEGQNKELENDIVYQMIIGDGEDYNYYEIKEFISKNNYENLLIGRYTMEKYPYSEVPILLFNEEKQLIPLVSNMQIPLEKLNEFQKKKVI